MFSKAVSFVVIIILISFSASSHSAQGYELFYNGQRVAHKTNMSLYQSIGNLHAGIKMHPDKVVTGYYNSKRILASGKGYELYHNGRRVGYKPNWPLHEAVKNLHWNQEKYPNMDVRGWYKGNKM
jgi:hypothetical protein